MPNDRLYDAVSEKVVKGWDFKKNLTSLQLSGLRPALNLYALFEKNNKNIKYYDQNFGTNFIKNFAIPVGTQQSEKTVVRLGLTDYYLCEIGKIETQTQEKGEEKNLFLKNTGGVALKNAQITHSTGESFNIRYKLDLTITNPELFNTRPHLRQLISLNSPFLLQYGWRGITNLRSTQSNQNIDININELTPNANQNEGEEEDTAESSYGFWQSELVVLQNYNFTFNNEGLLDGDLTFVSGQNQLLRFVTLGSVKDDLKEILRRDVEQGKKDGKLNIIKTYASSKESINPYSPATIDIEFVEKMKSLNVFSDEFNTNPIKIVSTEGVTETPPVRTKSTQSEAEKVDPPMIDTIYIQVGYVLRQLMWVSNSYANKNSDVISTSSRLKFKFKTISNDNATKIRSIIMENRKREKPQKDKDGNILSDEQGQNTISSETIGNSYNILVPFEDVMKLIEESTSTTSVLQLTNSILSDLIPQHNIGLIMGTRQKQGWQEIFIQELKKEDQSVFEVERLGSEFKKNPNQFQITYRSQDSLVQSVNLSAETDPGAFDTFSLNTILANTNVNKNLKELVNILKDRDKFQSTNNILAKEIVAFLGYKEGDEVYNVGKRIVEDGIDTVLNDFARQNPARYSQIVQTILSGNNASLKLLSFYLRRLDITIHGTCGLYAFQTVRVNGLIPTYDRSFYLIKDVTHSISDGEFKTTLGTFIKAPAETEEEIFDQQQQEIEQQQEIKGQELNRLFADEQRQNPENIEIDSWQQLDDAQVQENQSQNSTG